MECKDFMSLFLDADLLKLICKRICQLSLNPVWTSEHILMFLSVSPLNVSPYKFIILKDS